MSEVKAISVIDEAANAYYENYKNMPKDVRRDVSCHMLHNIFKHMVIPAIDKARQLDREGLSECAMDALAKEAQEIGDYAG